MTNSNPSAPPNPRVVRVLVPLCWTLRSALLVVLLYGLITVSTERSSSPEAPRGLGVSFVLLVLALLAGAGLLLNRLARKQSRGGLITMTLILAYPLVGLAARPIILAYKARKYEAIQARVGDFPDPALHAMARAIRMGDSETLRQLLNGQPPSAGKDRAGNDLLAYALAIVRDEHGGVEPVRVLLDAGTDPRTSRTGNGVDVLNFMVFGGSPAAREAVRLLLEHGADPNAVDPRTGETPIRRIINEPEILRLLVEHGADFNRIQPDGVPVIVDFIGSRQWDAALYLVEKGANLDARNAAGLSVDYYLEDWKESVFGDRPEGWAKLRAAIAKRRESHR